MRAVKNDYTGLRFGRLTVVSRDTSKVGVRLTYWLCRCDCGNLTSVGSTNLRRGRTKSCGCLRDERWCNPTHGQSGSITHNSWKSMKQRVRDNFKGYGKYEVHPAWVESYEAFLADVGERPSPKHTLDRIDGTKGYIPGNVRWATGVEQAWNRGSTRWVEVNGERLPMAVVARQYGIHEATLRQRLCKLGWPLEKALIPPKRKKEQEP